MMLPFVLPSELRGLVIKAGLCLALVLGLGAWIQTLRMQRDVARLERDRARLELQQMQVVLDGQRCAQATQLAQAQVDAERLGGKTKALIQGLESKLPKTDDQARVWALDAARRIQ